MSPVDLNISQAPFGSSPIFGTFSTLFDSSLAGMQGYFFNISKVHMVLVSVTGVVLISNKTPRISKIVLFSSVFAAINSKLQAAGCPHASLNCNLFYIHSKYCQETSIVNSVYSDIGCDC